MVTFSLVLALTLRPALVAVETTWARHTACCSRPAISTVTVSCHMVACCSVLTDARGAAVLAVSTFGLLAKV